MPISPSASAPRMASTKRVQADVAVGMRNHAAVERDADAADRDMIAGAESVHVIARGAAGIAGQLDFRARNHPLS